MTDPRYVNQLATDRLSREQITALIRICEECAEVTKAATKALRFGLQDTGPDGTVYDNHRDLEAEFRDVVAAVELLRRQTSRPRFRTLLEFMTEPHPEGYTVPPDNERPFPHGSDPD